MKLIIPFNKTVKAFHPERQAVGVGLMHRQCWIEGARIVCSGWLATASLWLCSWL